MTAAEVAEQMPEKVEWIAYPWVALGAITELDGQVKSAGKTTWATHMCRAVLDGLPFMEGPTLKTPVIYLTEQPASTFRSALHRADLLSRNDLHILFWNKTKGMPWPKIVETAVWMAQQVGAKLLVVDTIAQFANLVGDKENNSGDALQAMQPLQIAAAGGLGVLIVRHESKNGGAVGKSGRGSSAFTGAVDIVLSIHRQGGQASRTIRDIDSLSRYDDTPEKVTIDYTPGEGYVRLEIGKSQATEKAKVAVLDLLSGPTAQAMTMEEFEQATGMARASIQRALGELVGDQVTRLGEGKRGDPFRFCLTENHSAQTPSAMVEMVQ